MKTTIDINGQLLEEARKRAFRDKTTVKSLVEEGLRHLLAERQERPAYRLRKATFSYGNIRERKAFTVSIPTESQVKEADYIGIVSGREENKFDGTGLTPARSSIVDAPYVAECPIVLECRLLHTLEIGLHTQFIGEILDVKADEAVLDGEGTPDVEKIRPILFSPGTRTYHGLGKFLGTAFSVGRKS